MHVVSGAVLENCHRLTDEQLVLHVLTGRTALFELLIRRHGERIYRTIRAMVGNDTPAENLLVDTFVHAYAHLGRIPKDTTFVAWLSRAAIQTATRARRGPAPFVTIGGRCRPTASCHCRHHGHSGNREEDASGESR